MQSRFKTCHLKENNLGYVQHLKIAWSCALQSFTAGLIFLAHGIFPNKLTYQGSVIISNLHNKLSTSQRDNNHHKNTNKNYVLKEIIVSNKW